MTKLSKLGFTLIELLIVIAIAGLLATIVITGLQKSRAKSRDNKRVSDLAQMRNGLALALVQGGEYPSGGPFALGVSDRKVLCGKGDVVAFVSDIGPANCDADKFYMTMVPAPPNPSGETYSYQSFSGASFCIESELEVGSQNLTAGPFIVNEGALRNGTCPPAP